MRGALPLGGMAASPALKQGERYQNHTCSWYLPHRVLQLQLPGSPLANIFKSLDGEVSLLLQEHLAISFHASAIILFYM